MNSTSPAAFALSATLHAAVVAVMLIGGCALQREDKPLPIIELVAGAGDNFMAKEAPALGSEGGVKMNIPKAPEPKPAPPEPVPAPPEPTPIAPAPTPPPKPPVTPVPKAAETVPDFKKQLKQDVRVAVNKAKREIAKENAAEKKRLDAEKKRQEDEKKRMSKEDFDKANKQRQVASVNPKAITPKGIDAAGIKEGVMKGTGKERGAGGKALTSDNTDVLAAYDAMLKQRLREKFEPPPGLSDTLKVTLQVLSSANGSLTAARITRSSGVREFDQAVLEAIRRVQMPARPDKKSETIELNFGMRDLNEG